MVVGPPLAGSRHSYIISSHVLDVDRIFILNDALSGEQLNELIFLDIHLRSSSILCTEMNLLDA
jgi:hypothetical protein